MRRSAIALFFATSAACGVAFSPGDYRESGETTLDGSAGAVDGSSSGAAIDAGSSGVDGGPTRTRVALFAGRRDALPGESGSQIAIAETLLTSIGSDGTLGPFAFDAPSPTNTAWLRGGLVGETRETREIYLQTSTAFVHAPLNDRVGAWISGAIAPTPQPGIKPFIVDSHGILAGRSLGTITTSDPQTWAVTFVDAGPMTWQKTSARAGVDRGNATLARAGDHVYLVGGETSEKITTDGGAIERTPAAPAHAEVEVAKLDANGLPGDFHLTSSLPASGDGGAFAVFEPVTATSADHVYLLGGLATTNANSLTDLAFAAKIKDAATGDLDPWVALPKLPQAMTQFAVVATPSWLVVFGGQLAAAAGGKASATVLRLAIHADGTFGTSWETAGTLPTGGRAAIVGVTY